MCTLPYQTVVFLPFCCASSVFIGRVQTVHKLVFLIVPVESTNLDNNFLTNTACAAHTLLLQREDVKENSSNECSGVCVCFDKVMC